MKNIYILGSSKFAYGIIKIFDITGIQEYFTEQERVLISELYRTAKLDELDKILESKEIDIDKTKNKVQGYLMIYTTKLNINKRITVSRIFNNFKGCYFVYKQGLRVELSKNQIRKALIIPDNNSKTILLKLWKLLYKSIEKVEYYFQKREWLYTSLFYTVRSILEKEEKRGNR